MTIKSISKIILAASLVALTVTGCAPSISPNNYGTYSAGQVNNVVKGVVTSARIVNVAGSSTIGTIAGGAIGAIAGSAIGGGRGSILTAIGGGLVGAGLGNAAESRLTARQGIEYVIKTCNGCYVSVVQGPCPSFQRGQHVMVIYGDQARVVADPDYAG